MKPAKKTSDPRPVYFAATGGYRAETGVVLVPPENAARVHVAALARGHYPGSRLPENALPGLKTVGVAHSVRDGAILPNEHRKEGFALYFLECGQLGFSLDDRQYCLKPRDLIGAAPWQRHAFGHPPQLGFRLHWFVIDVEVRGPRQPWRWPAWIPFSPAEQDDFRRLVSETDPPLWSLPELAGSFRQMAAIVESGRPAQSIGLLAAAINQVLALLLHAARNGRPDPSPPTSPGLHAVEQFWNRLREDRRLLMREWTRPRMAAECGLGLTQFTRYTRQLTNQTPLNYLSGCRLAHAARMLREHPTRNITEIAVSVGISSGQYFSTVFKRHYHVPPQVYRASHLADLPPTSKPEPDPPPP